MWSDLRDGLTDFPEIIFDVGMKLRHVGRFNNSASGYLSIDELILLFDIALGNCSVESILFQFVRRISSVVSKFPIGNLKLVCLHQLFLTSTPRCEL